jgi:hypothetical protein
MLPFRGRVKITFMAWCVQVSMLLCLIDVSAGMSYLHSIGLLHSDLKGANVLLKSCAVTSSDPRGFLCKVCHALLMRQPN